MGPILKAAGATVVSTREPTHYPGGDAEPAILDYCVIDDRLANGRVLRSIQIDTHLVIGNHRAVRIELSNKGHICMVTRLLKPKAFPRKPPIGCPRMPVNAAGSLEEIGVDRFYAKTLACAEAEVARLHDLVEEDGTVRNSFVGRDLGLRTRRGLLLPPRSRACVGTAGEGAYILRWVSERLCELRFHCRQHEKGLLTLAGLKQAEGIKSRLRCLAKDQKRRTLLTKLDERWDSWLTALVDWDFDLGEDFLGTVISLSRQNLYSIAQLQHEAAQRRWRQWVKEKLKNGAAAVHAFVKRTEMMPRIVQGPLGTMDASPQAILEAEEAQWKEVWHRLEGKYGTPWREVALDQSSDLAPITAKQIKAAALTFSYNTAVGEDGLHPRAVAFLSDAVVDRYAQVLNTAEADGVWPALVTTNLIHLIPKAAGGMRPIGVMATLVRLYERVRRSAVAQWRASHCEEYDFMTGGRSSVDAVWCQSVRDEAVTQKGQVAASALLDLIKAFESVRLDIVWETGVASNFPMPVLRLALQAYCLARRLVYREVVGQPVLTTTAILAGGGFATDMLSLLLRNTLARIRREIPGIHLYVIVDDLTLRAEGNARHAAGTLVRATRQCIHDLEEDLDMRVSRGKPWTTPCEVKSMAMASTQEARVLLSTGMRSMGIPTRIAAKNLGVDYAPGRKMRQKVTLMARWQKVKEKTKRCKKIGKQAALHVSRTALVPSISYGIECTGLASGALKDLRGVVARLAGPLNGRSVTARLAMWNCEPAYATVLAPLKAWWKACWRGSLPMQVLEAALQGAAAAVEMSGRLEHSNVSGGAGAYLSSLKRIGWHARGSNAVVTEQSIILTLGGNCDPKMLLRLASAALGKKLAQDSSLSATLSSVEVADGYHRASSQASAFQPLGVLPGLKAKAAAAWQSQYQRHGERLIPWLRPAADALRAAEKRGVGEAVRRSFISLIEGGWWTQARLHHQGLATDPFCRKCGVVHGTLWHRAANLCTNEEAATPIPGIVEEGKRRWWDPLFSRGVPAMPLLPTPPSEYVWFFPETAADVLITGDVYTDGALKGMLPEARRSGWAFAKMGRSRGQVQAAFYGVCADPWPTIVRAELRAIEEALRRAVPPLTIYTDNAAVVNAFLRGESYACREANDGADIWRRIWCILAEFGDCRILKVKAHTTRQDAKEGLIDPLQQAGNATADFFAVQARKSAATQAPCLDFERHYFRARAWYRHIISNIAGWQQDALADAQACPEEDSVPHAAHQGEAPPTSAESKHSAWVLADGVLCRRCGRSFGSDARPSEVAKQRCRGPLPDRVLQSLGLRRTSDEAYAYTVAELKAAGASQWEAAGAVPSATPHAEPQVRRRLRGKQPPPTAERAGEINVLRKEPESGHLLITKGNVTYCERCGRWAINRLSHGLLRKCTASVDTKLGAYRKRRERLRAGLHPLTGKPLKPLATS